MSYQGNSNHRDFIPHLKICLELIEAFFKYLPYDKKNDLKYSLTYHYQETVQFKSIEEIVSEINRCIEYQIRNKKEIDIPAEIVFEQFVFVDGREICLFYHGDLIIHDSITTIFWNGYQTSPSVELNLNDTLPPSKILTLYKNFQIAINDIKAKYE